MTQELSISEALGFEMFDRFEYTRILPKEEKLKIIREAMRLGQSRARDIKKEFSEAPPEEILKAQGITVSEHTDPDSARPDFVKFAEFHVKRKQVLLNLCVLDRLAKRMNPKLARGVILCHELYHYFEMFRWGRTGDVFKRPVRLFGVLPVIRRILPAEEIAANSFTKEYLDLEFEPQEIERFYFENS